MNPKDLEALRKEFGYYQVVSDGQPYVPFDDWEEVVWAYVERLEQEVLSLREKIDDMNSRWEDIID